MEIIAIGSSGLPAFRIDPYQVHPRQTIAAPIKPEFTARPAEPLLDALAG
jgi:hypothetical protein